MDKYKILGVTILLAGIGIALLFIFDPDLLGPTFVIAGIIIVVVLVALLFALLAGNFIDPSSSWDPVKAELPKHLRRVADDDVLVFTSSTGKKVNHGTFKEYLALQVKKKRDRIALFAIKEDFGITDPSNVKKMKRLLKELVFMRVLAKDPLVHVYTIRTARYKIPVTSRFFS